MTKLGIMTAATECAASISYDTALAILAAHAAPVLPGMLVATVPLCF